MSQEEALRHLEKICEVVSKRGYISSSDRQKLKKIFGERADKAFALVIEKRVKKYIFLPSGLIRWIVVGKEEEDHLIFPNSNYCSCEDFFFQVLSGKVTMCSHIIAQKLAEKLNVYETFEENDKLHSSLLLSI